MKKAKTQDAILEIGCESLPARFLNPGLDSLRVWTIRALEDNKLKISGDGVTVETFGTPMRLAVIIKGLPSKTKTEEIEVTGPPARLWKEDTGKFTKQAEGFARKQGVKAKDLKIVKLPKGEFLGAKVTIKGQSTSSVLADQFPLIIEQVARDFPKTMVWEESRFKFGRPIRTLMALFGRKIISFKLAGVRSGNKVRGLAQTGGKPITITNPESYLRLLRDRCIIADPAERREKLLKTLAQAAKRSLGAVDEDENLITTTLHSTEHPVAVLCRFDEKFLELPAPLIRLVLKKQLMFFPILKKNGELTSDFIGVRDGLSEGQKAIQKRFEGVLVARFNDARFFIGRDRESTLESRLKTLERVGFAGDLGSMGDKTARVVELSSWIGRQVLQHVPFDGKILADTAQLAYADLVTDVVGEFPELQGTMGGVYARLEGRDEKVALGLEEFYFPVSAKAPLPTTTEGCLVSLAGKMDTISAMFSAGIIPSGSEDPFALRRLGNGVIRILLERQLAVSIPELVDHALDLVANFPAGRSFDRAKVKNDVVDFFWQRYETLLLEKGFKSDEIRSVREGGLARLSATFSRISAVHQLRPEPDFVAIAAAFKRASNILKKSGVDTANGAMVDKELLNEDAERALFDAMCRVEGDVREKVSEGFYVEGLRSLVGLKPQVDLFFDKVLVMAEEESVKRNRLNLLSRLVRLFKSVADISHIQN